MKFLFFDLECARTFKGGNGVICEFGYVLTDENFDVLKKDVLLIAPETDFNKYVVENMLAFKKEEYEAAPNFEARYEEIKRLFEEESVAVVGHTTDVDARCLNFATKRYGLPFIDFDFYDLKKIYMHRKKDTRSVGLERMLAELKPDFKGHIHRSDDDAYATMLVLKELCRQSGLDGASLIAEYAPFKGECAEGKVTKAKTPPFALTDEERTAREEERRARNEEKTKKRRIKRILESFLVYNTVEEYNFFYLTRLANSQIDCKIIKDRFADRKICIDRDYQKTHFKETVSLIWLIKRYGGKCIFYPNQCDIYIRAEVEEGYKRKYEKYLRTAERKNAQIIPLAELLTEFNVTEEGLYKMPFPPYEAFERKKSGENDK